MMRNGDYMLKRINALTAQGFIILLILSAFRSPAKAQQALSEIRQQSPHQLVLEMLLPGTYQVFHLQKPERVIIYLHGSALKAAPGEIKGAGGYIKYIKIYPFEGNYGVVRVEIGIAEGMQTRDWMVDNEIFLWVGKPSEAPPPIPSVASPSTPTPPPPPFPGAEPAPPSGEEPTPPETPATEAPQSAAATLPPAPTSPGRPATGPASLAPLVLATRFMARPGSAPRAMKLLDVTVNRDLEATTLKINTDGPVKGFDDFILTAPDRLVIDVFDTRADFTQPRLDVGSTSVASVRWGPHKDRTRIVIDLAASGFAPYYTIKKTRSGVEVTIYSNKTAAQAPASDFTTHTVAAGENLQMIARKAYGDPRAWRRIVSSNRDKFMDANAVLDSEGLLYPETGTVLRLPVR